MAEKKIEKSEVKETKVTKDAVVAPAVTSDEVADERRRRLTIIWIVVVGIVLIFILVILLFTTLARHYAANFNNMNQRGYSQVEPIRGRNYGWNQMQITTSSSSTDGPTTTTTQTTYTLTQGVVTKVESGSLTIAGNGKAQKVTTNSSTTYVDGQKPSANDSVAVWGTVDSHGNITATKVEVLNN